MNLYSYPKRLCRIALYKAQEIAEIRQRSCNCKPVLVTGSHRSGTTWVGRVLATSPCHFYVHEPFNIDYPCKRSIIDCHFDTWFKYLTDSDSTQYREPFSRLMRARYDPVRAFYDNTPILKVLSEYTEHISYQFLGVRPIIKDPIAIFSAEWMCKNFDLGVVVMIRHPCAFASSLKRLDWSFDFSHFFDEVGKFIRF